MFKTETMSVMIDGREIIFETGKVARQANGAVILRSGETVLLATACASPEPLPDVDFLPLRVDHQEKFSSAGKTLGGYIKREGRPTEREILICRLIDRPLRPMFEKGWYHDTQVFSCLFSYDGVHSPDPLAVCAVSAALAISDIPLKKPVAAVQVGFIEGRFVINPTLQEMQNSRLDLMLAGTNEAILMIEGYADFLPEDQVLKAIEEGHRAIQLICDKISEWADSIGKSKNLSTLHAPSQEIENVLSNEYLDAIEAAIRTPKKQQREEHVKAIKEAILEKYCADEKPLYKKNAVVSAFKNVQANIMRTMILNENIRSDGRKCNEIRPITVEHSFLPRTHGSVLFTRGETQALCVATLGGETMVQKYETLAGEQARRFYLQYFFPPFSVGEVGRLGSPGRREIGHGKLAERALAAALPSQEQFPYVIRLESNITESNGSSSMASVCGGCIAMMDAGVPLRHPISGIAMGLILENNKRFAILSDILGAEDALGDMDFKVTGNETGITAFQLDIKVEGITLEIMQAALLQAKEGRIHILKKMLEVLPKHKEQLSKHAPRIASMKVKPSKIGVVIGPGGKQIRAIIEETGAEININDDGIVSITSHSQEAMDRAKKIIHDLTAEVEIGKTYRGTVVSIVAFGMFVQIYGQQGLCHISELANERVENVRSLFKEGQEVDVKVLEINANGQIRLSHKATLPALSKA